MEGPFSGLRSVDKLKLAAQLVEEVAYAQAGHQSQHKVAHLMLVAANLEKLAEAADSFCEPQMAWYAGVR